MQPLATGFGLFAMAFVFGATVWFFFIQSPYLLTRLGREKFVPLQMMLVRALAKALLAGTLIVLGAAFAAGAAPGSGLVISAAIAVFGALVNERFVIPKALRAGGKGHREIRGKDDEASTAGFASDGVGEATSALHRLVVLLVVVMLGGAVTHGLLLLGLVG